MPQCFASVHLNSELASRSEYKVGVCGHNIGANSIVTVSKRAKKLKNGTETFQLCSYQQKVNIK